MSPDEQRICDEACGCNERCGEPIRHASDETVRAITERHFKRWRVALERMAEWPTEGADA